MSGLKTTNKIYQNIIKRLPNRLKTDRVVIAGWEASGSTFVLQIIKQLGHDFKKIHGYKREFNNHLVFYTFRDPRDSIVSNARRHLSDMWEKEGREAALIKEIDNFIKRQNHQNIYIAQSMKNVILIRYETFFNGHEKQLIKLIADQLLVPLTEDKINTIYNNSSINKNIERAKKMKGFKEFDRDTFIHGQHISNKGKSGAWQKHFTPKVKAKFKDTLNPLLLALGYESDRDW